MKPKIKKYNMASAITKKKRAASNFEDDNIVQPSAARIQKVIRPGGKESYELVDDKGSGGIDESCLALIFILDVALLVGGAYLYLTIKKCPKDDRVQSDVSPETEIFTTSLTTISTTITTMNSGATPPAIQTVPTTSLQPGDQAPKPTTTTGPVAVPSSDASPTSAPGSNASPSPAPGHNASPTSTPGPNASPAPATSTAPGTTTVHHTKFKCGASSDSGTKWPWHIRLAKRKNPGTNDFIKMCSATIVSPLNALTAMTCFKGMSKLEITEDVRGAFEKDFLLKNLESYYKVIKVRHHPLGRTLPLLVRDLTLLTFGKKSGRQDRISPVCLPTMKQRQDHSTFKYKECFVLIWDTSTQNRQKCTVRFTHPVVCKVNFEDTTVVKDAIFCTEVYRSETKCFGMIETGSPMVCKDKNLWYLYGIKSNQYTARVTPNRLATFAEVVHATDWLCCLFPGIWPCSKPSVLSLPAKKICKYPKNIDRDDVLYSSVMEVNAEPWSMRLHMKKHWTADVFSISKCEATIVSPKYAVTSTSCLVGKSKAWIISSLAATTRLHVEDDTKDIIRMLAVKHEESKIMVAPTVLDDFTVLVFKRQIPESELTSEVYLSAFQAMAPTERCFVAFSNRPVKTQIFCPVFYASAAECREQFPKEMSVVGPVFCVKSAESQENIDCLCKVLRGAPMVCEKNNLWHLRGVTRLDDGCKEKNLLLLSDIHNNVFWLCCILKLHTCKNVVCNAS